MKWRSKPWKSNSACKIMQIHLFKSKFACKKYHLSFFVGGKYNRSTSTCIVHAFPMFSRSFNYFYVYFAWIRNCGGPDGKPECTVSNSCQKNVKKQWKCMKNLENACWCTSIVFSAHGVLSSKKDQKWSDKDQKRSKTNWTPLTLAIPT